MLKILAIIPARGGSKGIPMKNIQIINGKPLLYYSVKAAHNSKEVDRTIVSTDHPHIEKIAKKNGAEVIKRPKIIATDKARIEPVMFHVINSLKKDENYIPDIIILLQNTSPLRTSNDIDNAIKIFKKNKYDSLLSVSPSHYFLWKKIKKSAKPVNYDPLNRPNRQEIKDEFVENGAIYISKYSNFIKSKCRISGKIGLYVMKPEVSIEIDSRIDFEIVEKIMKQKNSRY